jgi:hypothetical protein
MPRARTKVQSSERMIFGKRFPNWVSRAAMKIPWVSANNVFSSLPMILARVINQITSHEMIVEELISQNASEAIESMARQEG